LARQKSGVCIGLLWGEALFWLDFFVSSTREKVKAQRHARMKIHSDAAQASLKVDRVNYMERFPISLFSLLIHSDSMNSSCNG
jgi:hypothetical protein